MQLLLLGMLLQGIQLLAQLLPLLLASTMLGSLPWGHSKPLQLLQQA
jgi:hypothetical protein